MHETLKYWLVACWLIFLFIPLIAAITITALVGVAGVWGIICHWIIPSTIYARKKICRFNQAKEELGEMIVDVDKTINYLRDVDNEQCKKLIKRYDVNMKDIANRYARFLNK